MMQSRNGKFPTDPFSTVNSMLSSMPFNFCNVSPRSCDIIANYRQLFSTIDEGCLTWYKDDFLPLFEYKFLRNMVKLVHL